MTFRSVLLRLRWSTFVKKAQRHGGTKGSHKPVKPLNHFNTAFERLTIDEVVRNIFAPLRLRAFFTNLNIPMVKRSSESHTKFSPKRVRDAVALVKESAGCRPLQLLGE